MSKEHQLDEIDRKILNYLLKDSRMSFQEIARELVVSGGTVHVRVNKMKEMGIITGSKIVVDVQKLGMEVCAFIGVNLVNAKVLDTVLKNINYLDQIVEVHYTTGQYSLLLKVYAKSTRDLHLFLVEKLQKIEGIQSSETFISLDNPINKDIVP
ncbi:MAG: Lrp/AsnC ligand binding domain-containing protein [Halobacteriovoraceae bacterium]|nr:Lrp/AsnC ligand binding domain-containing protein [Halobacteriovoraceae bacterium]